MAAPKGNKNAIGHGRPPNPGYTDEDIAVLCLEMDKWMEDNFNNPSVVHLSQWWSQIKNIPNSQWESLIHRSCFLSQYEKAKKWMGVKIMTNKKLAESYGNRFLGMYFSDMHEHEMNKMERKVDYEIKKKKEALNESLGYPNDAAVNDRISLIKVQSLVEDLKKENEALKDKLASQSKADSIVQPSK